jgi:hypothetical protein
MIILIITQIYGFSANIYVSKNGNDAIGNGSFSNPYATISKALEESVNGDNIFIREGVYTEAVRIRNANITLQSYNNEQVIISTPIDNEEIDTTVIFDVDADGGTLKHLEITGGYYYGVMLFTKWDWGEADRSGVSHITIDNCKIHDTGRDCIKITPNCDYVTIKNCEIYNSGIRYNENAEGIDNVNADYMIVKDCYIHNTGTTGVYAKGGASDIVIERNIIENCGMFGVGVGFDTSPEYFDLAVNPNRYETIRTVVKNCLIINTEYAGIAFYGALNSSAFNNTIVNTAKTGHTPIYFGVTLQDWEPDSNPNDNYNYRPASKNIKIYNNIVIQDIQTTSDIVFIRTFYHEDTGRVNGYDGLPEMDNNCYYLNGINPTFSDMRPEYNLESMNFTDWQTHISNEFNTLIANPELDSTYKPESNSPCINAGNSAVSVEVDLENNIRDSQIDIGAYEYQNGDGEGIVITEDNIYYIPHIAHSNYKTYLNVYNPNSESVEYCIYYYDKNGEIIETYRSATNPYSTHFFEISSVAEEKAVLGKIGIVSGSAIFKVAYFNEEGGMAEYIATNSLKNKLIYTFPTYNNQITWNGIACFNTAKTEITLTMKIYFQGTNLETKTITLQGNTNLVDLVENIFLNSGLHNFDMIEISTSSSVLCGLNISGVNQENLLFSTAN